jgi:hypothetical protein
MSDLIQHSDVQLLVRQTFVLIRATYRRVNPFRSPNPNRHSRYEELAAAAVKARTAQFSGRMDEWWNFTWEHLGAGLTNNERFQIDVRRRDAILRLFADGVRRREELFGQSTQ